MGVVDADGEIKADVLAASGEGVQNSVRTYLGRDFVAGTSTESASRRTSCSAPTVSRAACSPAKADFGKV